MQLENADRYNRKIAYQYKEKLSKLESTQNIAVALIGIKMSKRR